MAIIINDGQLNGFPLDMIQNFQQKSLRNGQRCRARTVSALEQAVQYLAAARKISLPALTTPIVVSGSLQSIALCQIPVDLFSDIVTVYGFVSTNDEQGGAVVSVFTSLGSQALTIPGSLTDTIEDARKFVIEPSQILLTKTNVPGFEDISLSLNVELPATTLTLWSLSIIVDPARTAP
jgi:hypothetical protein